MTTKPKGRARKPQTLGEAIDKGLRPLDAKAAKEWLEDLAAAGKEAGEGKAIDALIADADLAGFVGAVMDLSRFCAA